MQIQAISPEVISTQDYQPTDIENLFVHAESGAFVIIGQEVAYLIQPDQTPPLQQG